jgi:hypothetical protein
MRSVKMERFHHKDHLRGERKREEGCESEPLRGDHCSSLFSFDLLIVCIPNTNSEEQTKALSVSEKHTLQVPQEEREEEMILIVSYPF